MRKTFTATSLVILVYLVFYLDIFRAHVWTVESSGKHALSVFAKSSSKVMGFSQEGIHVIGLGKSKGESVHIGLIEDFNRLAKLEEISTNLKTMAGKYRYVGITTNGGTHAKPALTRLRDDVAMEMLNEGSVEGNFSPVQFFKKYNMGKFLSVEHGANNPYLMIHDGRTGNKVVEKSGKINARIKFRVVIPPF